MSKSKAREIARHPITYHTPYSLSSKTYADSPKLPARNDFRPPDRYVRNTPAGTNTGRGLRRAEPSRGPPGLARVLVRPLVAGE